LCSFFFSSRRRHTRFSRDWSSDVCSSDLELLREMQTMQNELDAARTRVSELQTAEAELQRAVIAAERIGNEIKENAKREASMILTEAERVRDSRLSSPDSLVDRSRADLDRMGRERSLFREQFKGLLNAYLRSLEATAEVADTLLDERDEPTPEVTGRPAPAPTAHE